MSRSHRLFGIIVIVLFGAYGCSRTPSADSAHAEKIKSLETKMARLEDDFRAAASARDQLGKKLLAAEDARTALQVQVAQMNKEIKAKEEQILNRTSERDQVTNQYKLFRDGIRELMTRADDGKMEPPASPSVPVIPTSNTKPDVSVVPNTASGGK